MPTAELLSHCPGYKGRDSTILLEFALSSWHSGERTEVDTSYISGLMCSFPVAERLPWRDGMVS